MATKLQSRQRLQRADFIDLLRHFWARLPRSWGILLLIMILAAEILLRMPAVTQRLPDPNPRLWHALLVQDKLDYLANTEAQRDIDVLFMGNSTMQAGVNPVAFDEARRRLSNGASQIDPSTGISFNAAIEGLPPVGNEKFLPVFLKRSQPEMIIYGVSAQDLNSNSPWAADVSERVNNAPLVVAESDRGVRGWFVRALVDNSQIYRYRSILLQTILTGGRQVSHLEEVYFDERGHDAIERKLSDIAPENRDYLYNNAGVLNYDADGVQAGALRRLIDEMKVRGIVLILVNMPLADDYYDNFDQVEDYAQYLNAIETIAVDTQIPFWDMESLGSDNFGDTEFADFNHLNAEGAVRLSRILANRLSQ